jgi:TRAP-type C4-dicarboxylate transport system permease small subunit
MIENVAAGPAIRMAPDAYARIAVVWLTFIGYALAAHAGEAIRVDLFDHWLSSRARRILAAIFDAVMLATLVLLISTGWLLVELGADQAIPGTDFTTALPNAGFFVGCIALFAFLAGRSFLRFAGEAS